MEKLLLNRGFKKLYNDCYRLFDEGITVRLVPFTITVTNADQSIVNEKVKELTEAHGENKWNIIDNVIEWVNKIEGFGDEEPEENNQRQLPIIECTNNRKLVIYTWGRRLRTSCPKKIDQNFNASVIYGYKRGSDIKKNDGRSTEIQEMVIRGKQFCDFMGGMIASIEKNNLKIIGINCAKGRHRSVSCAEILKKHYYPYSEIFHLELR